MPNALSPGLGADLSQGSPSLDPSWEPGPGRGSPGKRGEESTYGPSSFCELLAHPERPLRPALGSGSQSWYRAGVGGLARPGWARSVDSGAGMQPRAALCPPAPRVREPGLLGLRQPRPGCRPPSGTRRPQRHALGHHPADVGGPGAAPSPGSRRNEMLMRRE